jgi:hypothetical protein
MTRRQQHRQPPPRDLATLLAQVEEMYQRAASPQGEGPAAANPALWQGDVLHRLDHARTADPQEWAEAARACGLDTADGVRAILTLSCASAVAAALRFALGAVEPATGEPATPEAVLDEIATCQWWLDGQSHERADARPRSSDASPRPLRLVKQGHPP